MADSCTRHQFEAADDFCRTCGGGFCSECLVYSFGRNQPPFCLNCALAAAGVRSNAARQPTMSRREMRARTKERRKADKEARKVEVAVAASPVVEIDWSVPPTPAGEDDGLGWLEDYLPQSDERVMF
jgi:hypothetical protein